MLYKIPGDKGHPWRLQKFIEFHADNDMDCDYRVLNTWAEEAEYDNNQKIWLAFLYSMCMCASTAILIARRLPLRKLSPMSVDGFWRIEKYKKLQFSHERRHVRTHGWFPMICKDIHDKMREHGTMVKWINSLIAPGDPLQTYENMVIDFSQLLFFAKFSTALLIESMVKIVGIKADTANISWRKSELATSGMLLILYKDEEAAEFDKRGVMLTKTNNMLKTSLFALREAMTEVAPHASQSTLDIDKSLRNFRRLFKQRVYKGYWLDKQLEDLNMNERAFPEFDDTWAKMFEYRNVLFEEEQLGEVVGYHYVQDQKMKNFLRTGKF